MESEKWTEKTILDSGKQTDGVSVTRDASANAANEGKETGNDNEGGNDDGQTDGKTDNPYDSIERPAQSDTIEMIPGAPSDSKDKESDSGTDTKTDTKADTAEGSNPESGAAGESNDQNEQEKEGESENQPEGGQETEVKPLPAEEKNYDYIYDKEAGKFKITFHIKEDAKGDQTVELSKVMEEINAAGKKQFDEWFKTEEGAKELDDAQYYGSTIRQSFDGVEYIYNPVNGTASLYEEPGCTTVFDVYLTNGSKHTYVYKNNSFTVSTPDMSNSDHTGVTGFDGQELPEDYTKGFLSPKYDIENASTTGVIEDLVDKALQDTQSQWQYGIDKDGNLTTSHSQKLTKNDIKIGTPVYKIRNKYYLYSEKYDCYYGEFNQAQVEENPKGSGKYVVKLVPSSGKNNYAIKADGSNYYAPYVRGSEINALKPSASRIQMAVKNYLSKNNTTLAQEVLKYYNEKDGTSYATIEELLSKNETAMDELTKSGAADNASLKSLDPMLLHSSSQYDNFYQNIFSFNVGSQEDMKKFLENENLGHGHSHGNWATDGCEMTIGDYMADKLNETDGAWDKANAYFNALLKSGVSSEEATWVAFTMATNIDGPRADNDYHNTAWNWTVPWFSNSRMAPST